MVLQFHAQERVLDLPNRGRFYLHTQGISVYGSDPIRAARDEFTRARQFLAGHQKHYSWVLGILWGEKHEPIIDLFVYTLLSLSEEGWKLNPQVAYAQFRSGKFIENPRGLTCGDGLIVLGKEEEHRRRFNNLEQYLREAQRFGQGN